jgi:cytochrome c-type biogenesis protein CcmH
MRRKIMRTFMALLLALPMLLVTLALTPSPSFAVEPDEILKDPKLEARARHISKGLRCLVCQNESIDDSNADLAKDLRVLLRERLVKGDSDEEAVQYIVDRYGEFVLLQPRFSLHTFVLWLGPLLALALAGYYIYGRTQASADIRPEKPKELSEEEKKKLEKMLAED